MEGSAASWIRMVRCGRPPPLGQDPGRGFQASPAIRAAPYPEIRLQRLQDQYGALRRVLHAQARSLGEEAQARLERQSLYRLSRSPSWSQGDHRGYAILADVSVAIPAIRSPH